MKKASAAVWLACGSLACGDAGLAGRSGSSAIVDGELTDALPQVVAITPRRVQCGEVTSVLCTGTLIAPNAVLSAAHCFDSRRPGLAYEIVTGSAVTMNANRTLVLEVIPHPEFDERTRANDVAVLWLAAPVGGIAPYPLPPPSSTQPGQGERVQLAGFGATEAGTSPDGAKRAGAGRVSSVGVDVIDVEPDPAVSCVGDSGGPLFGADGELVGVASSGDTGCRLNSIYARVAPAVATFIEPTLAEGPFERPPAGNTCGSACVADDDCPAGFVCIPEPDGSVFACALPGEAAGVFTDACADDGACGDGFCAETSGDEACRCYASCASMPSGTSGGGCSVTPNTGVPAAVWLLTLGAWAWWRRRR